MQAIDVGAEESTDFAACIFQQTPGATAFLMGTGRITGEHCPMPGHDFPYLWGQGGRCIVVQIDSHAHHSEGDEPVVGRSSSVW